MTIGNDIDRAAVFGGDNRQSTCGRFQQRQSKGFGQRGVDEDTFACRDHAVDLRDLVGTVALGQRDAPVQVIGIDQQQDVCQHALGAGIHVADIVAVAGDDQQVRCLLQR